MDNPTAHERTIREHVESVLHRLLDAIERNTGKVGLGAPEAVSQYAHAVASLTDAMMRMSWSPIPDGLAVTESVTP